MIPIPLPWKLLALAFALAVAWTTGWRMRGSHEAARQLAAERAAHETYVKTVDGWHAAVQEITRQREEDRHHAQNDRRTWQQQLDAVRAARAAAGPAAPADPDRADRLGPGSPSAGLGRDGHPGRDCRDGPVVDRRLWDDALAIGLPAALRPRPPAGPRPAPDPAAAGAAAAVPLDLALENLADNGQRCNDLRGMLLDWQDWARSLGAAP